MKTDSQILDEIESVLASRGPATSAQPSAPTLPSPTPSLIRIPNVQHRYATMSPWNLDNSAMVLEHPEGEIWLHHGDGRPYMKLPGVSASSEIIWSKEATIFYFLSGDEPKRNKLMRFDISKSWAKAASVVREFSEYSKISGLGESDISESNGMVFIGDEREVFVFDLNTGTKGPVLDVTGHPVESLYLTASNQVLISWA